MRTTRWETLGDVAGAQPRDDEIVTGELDEDFEPALKAEPAGARRESTVTAAQEFASDQTGPRVEGPDFGDEDDRREAGSTGTARLSEPAQAAVEGVRPFANLVALPDDVVEAFEAFKLAIVRHKSDGWRQVSRDEMLATLDGLKELVLAPAVDGAAF